MRLKFGICASTPIEPEDGERRRVDSRRNTGHQVTAAGRDLVDADDQRNIAIANSRKLRCGQTVLVHDAAVILEAHDHFIVAPSRHRESR